jgi:hypothetical protein
VVYRKPSAVIFEGDWKMELTHKVRHEVVNREMSIMLGVSIFAILMLIAVVLVAGGPGTSFQDYASVIAASP